jgi:hypothetical protein
VVPRNTALYVLNPHNLPTSCYVYPTDQAYLLQTAGNEFVHLPVIVETAESSPSAAKEAAHRIRRYLSAPDKTPNHVQYNAIMLMRILVDNPGHTFTRNIDAKFVTTIKTQLRQGRDWHVQHYLREYLSTLEAQRNWDQDLAPLLQMWSKEKHKATQSWVRTCFSFFFFFEERHSIRHPPANHSLSN